MALRFAVRGDAYDARYATGYKRGTRYNSGSISLVSGGLAGNRMDFTNTGVVKYITWSGIKNTPNGRTISILIRYTPNYSGAPAATRAILELNTGASGTGAFLVISHTATTGAITINGRNQAGAATFSSVSFGNWTTNSSGTSYDLVLTYTGDTTSNGGKFYIDATLLGQATPSNALDSGWDEYFWKSICFGAASGINTSAAYLEELAIWDTVITPSSVALVGGTGSLNGASRTALVDATSFEGESWSTLSADKIKTGESQTQAGLSVTGTYDGSDRWSDPGESNVRSLTAYKANNTSNNKTGTCAVPSAANTKVGVSVDNTTGTYDGSDRHTDPGIANVRAGQAYKSNSTSDNRTGTLDVPTESEVKVGVTFDDGSSEGTYDGSDRWTDPGEGNVADGVQYKANSLTDNKTGQLQAVTIQEPIEYEIEEDITVTVEDV